MRSSECGGIIRFDDRLSVPFSSGWALRSAEWADLLADNRIPFSSLFVGMGLAILPKAPDARPISQFFQFPFRRDGPCDSFLAMLYHMMRRLSVPFSSGWALRWPPPEQQPPDYQLSLSVPFSSGWALRLPRPKIWGPTIGLLSVPFSSGWALRSILCDLDGQPYDYTFSSLFVGMGLAIIWHGATAHRCQVSFQFPFRRDGPCDVPATWA